MGCNTVQLELVEYVIPCKELKQGLLEDGKRTIVFGNE